MVNVTALEIPPPGGKLTTVICAVPCWAISEDKIEACNCESLRNFVLRGILFSCTVDVETKLVPLTMIVNAEPPAETIAGDKLVAVGAGFGTLGEGVSDGPPGVRLNART